MQSKRTRTRGPRIDQPSTYLNLQRREAKRKKTEWMAHERAVR